MAATQFLSDGVSSSTMTSMMTRTKAASLHDRLAAIVHQAVWPGQRPVLVSIYERSGSGSAAANHTLVCRAFCGKATPESSLVEMPFDESLRLALPLTGSEGERLGFIAISRDADLLSFEQYDALTALCQTLSLTIENDRLRGESRRTTERQRLLDQIAGHLHQTLDLNDLIQRIFTEVNLAIHAEAQSLWLLDEDAGMIHCRFATGPGAESVTKVFVPSGEGIVGTTVAQQQSLLIADAQKDARHSRRAEVATGMVTHSLMSVPIVRNERAIGAIQAINKQTGSGRFEESDLTMLRSIADIAALCIENARLFADLEASYETTLEALAAALDARDHETEGHSRRVVAYCERFAEAANLSPEEKRSLRRGALIHDLGKIGVPDAILRKPGALNEDEWKIMASHPEIGFSMLRGITHLRSELDIVRAHHERWDGAGYPLQLAGNDIPRTARLFSIIDTYDAITSNRPYRAARTHTEAARLLSEVSGSQFDPELIALFLTVPEADWAEIRAEVAAAPTGGYPGYREALNPVEAEANLAAAINAALPETRPEPSSFPVRS